MPNVGQIVLPDAARTIERHFFEINNIRKRIAHEARGESLPPLVGSDARPIRDMRSWVLLFDSVRHYYGLDSPEAELMGHRYERRHSTRWTCFELGIKHDYYYALRSAILNLSLVYGAQLGLVMAPDKLPGRTPGKDWQK